MKHLIIGLGLATLAACDGGSADAPPANVTKIRIADSEYIEQLRALGQQERDLTLRRAVQDSGSSCRRVEGSEESGTYENMIVWTVRCDNADWAVFTAPTGDVQVRSCEHVQQLGLPGCGEAGAQTADGNQAG